jgi:hypothetical protein
MAFSITWPNELRYLIVHKGRTQLGGSADCAHQCPRLSCHAPSESFGVVRLVNQLTIN